MGLAVLCLVLIWWLERRDLKSTLVAGGFFGLVLLFRTQSLLVLASGFYSGLVCVSTKNKRVDRGRHCLCCRNDLDRPAVADS